MPAETTVVLVVDVGLAAVSKGLAVSANVTNFSLPIRDQIKSIIYGLYAFFSLFRFLITSYI